MFHYFRFATLVFAACASFGAQAEGFGRLFFTPEQRAQIDREHAQQAAAEGGRGLPLALDGIVQRSGGARTVWINGLAQNADGGRQPPYAHAVAVSGKRQPVVVKVGQRLLLEQDAAP